MHDGATESSVPAFTRTSRDGIHNPDVWYRLVHAFLRLCVQVLARVSTELPELQDMLLAYKQLKKRIKDLPRRPEGK